MRRLSYWESLRDEPKQSGQHLRNDSWRKDYDRYQLNQQQVTSKDRNILVTSCG